MLRLVERLPALRSSLPPEGDTVPRLVKLVASVRDAAERCRGCCLVYRAATAYDSCNSTELTSLLSTQLQSTWDSIDVGWVRVDVGFRIAAALSECAKPLAREYLTAATSLKSQIALESEAAASAYILPVRLAVRALKGLLRWRLDTPEDLDRLALLIDRIPSNGERARIWSDVALCIFRPNPATDSD